MTTVEGPRTRRQRRRFALEQRLAPHVEPRWTEGLLLELRLRGVAGDRIGAVVAEVDSHCAESGEQAADAFGDPVAYARSLELAPAEGQSPAAIAGGVAAAALQALAFPPAVFGLAALGAGEPLGITGGMVAVLCLLVAGTVGLAAYGEHFLRMVLRRPVLSVLASLAPTGLMVAALVLLDDVVATAPAGAAIGVGVVLMGAGTTWELVQRRRTGDDADPLVLPLDGALPPSRGAKLAEAAGRWLVPTVFVAMLAAGWLLPG
ncbi:hypothetical protein [Blastococcus sp. SYSU DS0617]